RYPHVITHLFMDGGRILKTIKTSYAEHVKSERLAEVVRGLMKEQHKAMFIALRDGQFDRIIEGEEGSKSGERPSAGRAAAAAARLVEADRPYAEGAANPLDPQAAPDSLSNGPPVSTVPGSTSQIPDDASGSRALEAGAAPPQGSPTGRVGRREAPDL